MSDPDDLFASLGGSLIKDLMADLAVGEDDTEWLSLEQLEQELKRLDEGPDQLLPSSTFGTGSAMMPPTTAAGWVMTHHQPNHHAFQPPPPPAAPPSSGGMDAWSLSLQKFTSTALEEDFLKADSANRKQKTTTTTQPPPPPPGMAGPPPGLSGPPPGLAAPPGLDFSKAEEYDTNEKATVVLTTTPLPPPGLSAPPGVVTAAAVSREVVEEELAPVFNENDVDDYDEEDEDDAGDQVEEMIQLDDSKATTTPAIPKPAPVTPHNSIAVASDTVAGAAVAVVGADDEPDIVVEPELKPDIAAGMPMVPHHHPGMPPAAAMAVPMAVPLPQRGPAWQQHPHAPPPPPHHHHHHGPPPPQYHPHHGPPPPHHQQPHKLLFANPRFDAPPIPASAIASKYMKQRDIAYVVHGILRSILISQQDEAIEDRYDIQYYQRRIVPTSGGPPAPQGVLTKPTGAPVLQNPKKKTTNTNNNKKQQKAQDGTKQDKQDEPNDTGLPKTELESRQIKAKEWSKEHAVLGHTTKTDVARPRALIAVSPAAGAAAAAHPEDAPTQRAALWKSRIYVDQAYQAMAAVVDTWKSATPGQVAGVQPHLIKLFKCLGIHGNGSGENTKYTVDATALQLLVKLNKGKLVLARVLEQALLPPMVVQVMLPTALQVLYKTTTPNNSSSEASSPADDRLFAAWTRVVQTLPNLSGESILSSCRMVQEHPQAALSSTSRMQCVHALLHRGGRIAAEIQQSDGVTDKSYLEQWSQTEQAFMKILAGM